MNKMTLFQAQIKGLVWRSQIDVPEDFEHPYLDCQNEKRVRGGKYNVVSPVHQHANGLWWFNDETESDEFGGYVTKEECEEAYKRYAEWL